jgi:hypothetical protein
MAGKSTNEKLPDFSNRFHSLARQAGTVSIVLLTGTEKPNATLDSRAPHFLFYFILFLFFVLGYWLTFFPPTCIALPLQNIRSLIRFGYSINIIQCFTVLLSEAAFIWLLYVPLASV